MPFLYVKKNNEYVGKYKYGYTNNPQKRLHDSHDALSYKSEYVTLYEISIHPSINQNWKFDYIFSKLSQNAKDITNIEQRLNCKLYHLRTFSDYVIKNGGGIEFMIQDGLEYFNNVVMHEFKYFGLTIVKNYTNVEIEIINSTPPPTDNYDTQYNPYTDNNVLDLIAQELLEYELSLIDKTTCKITLRDYQTVIVNELFTELRDNKRASVDLATGAGKTTIAFTAFSRLNPKNIVVVTPRRILCKQNIEEKYMQMLKRDYNIIIDANNEQFAENNLVSICIQSLSKFLDKLEKLDDVLIWFDEAHWAINSKLAEANGECSRLLNFKNISYLCFTSATWDITNMPNHIYGKRIFVISPAELIRQGWLCDLSLRTYETANNDVNNARYIISQFEKLNKTNGAVFHNTKANAKCLFKNHYDAYTSGITNIKPFINVDDLREMDDINLTYCCTSIDEYKATPNSIVYAVQKISMGFDFPKLDYIVFADPRCSPQDIIQVVGRGTRADSKGVGGRNKDKHLDIMLFTKYVNDESPYSNIVDTLRALVNEYEIAYDRIIINGNDGFTTKNGKNYSGNEILESLVYNLYSYKLPAFITILKRAGVKDINDYHTLRLEKEHLNLPYDPYIKHGDKQFCFEMVHEAGLYYTRNECDTRVRELLVEYPEFKNGKYRKRIVDQMKKLHNLDNKIPPYDPKKYYGYDC